MTSRPWPRLFVAVVVALLLAGCAGGLRPGLAARVVDEQVSMSSVDALATAFCTLQGNTQQGPGASVPGRQPRSQALFSLFVRAAAQQYAEEHGLQLDPDASAEVNQARQTAETLPEEQQQAFLDAVRAQVYTDAAITEIGRRALVEEGTADPDDREAQQRGAQLLLTWLQQAEVEIAPGFGVAVTENGLESVDTSVSVPVSEFAVKASAEQADAAWVASLPAAQRCG